MLKMFSKSKIKFQIKKEEKINFSLFFLIYNNLHTFFIFFLFQH